MTATRHWAHSESDLLSYLSGDLDGSSYARFEAHLENCPSCRSMIAEQLSDLEAEPLLPEASRRRMDGEFDQLLRSSERPARRVPQRSLYWLAAALTLSVLVSVAILRRPAPTLGAATAELIARVDGALPNTLDPLLWTPVSVHSRDPILELGDSHEDSDLSELVMELEEAEALEPESTELRLALAHTQLAVGNATAAELNYRLLLDADPGLQPARIGLAAALHNQERLAEAIELLEEIPESADEARAALFNRAVMSLELGQNAQAEQLTALYAARYGDDKWLQILQIRISRRNGR